MSSHLTMRFLNLQANRRSWGVLRVSFVIGCLFWYAPFGAGTARAQRAVENIQPLRTEVTKRASLITTERFKPQINKVVDFQRFIPENPLIPGWRKEWTWPWNNQAVGGVLPVRRTERKTSYPGVDYTGWFPPDPDIAVGPNQLVVTVNSSLAFFNKSDGANTFQQKFKDFFAGMGAGTFLFDPKCFYDRNRGRFFVSCLEKEDSSKTSKVLLAVSDDSNPEGTWYRYRIEAGFTISGVKYWLDYHSNGHNQDAIVYSGNLFKFTSGFGGAAFLVIDKAPLLSGGTATVSYLRDNTAGSVQMCEMIGSDVSSIYGVSDLSTGALKVHALRNLTGTPSLTSQTLSVPAFNYPTTDAASTGGRTLDVLDGRLISAIWRDGAIVTVHTIRAASQTENRIRWYEILTNNWPSSGSVTLAQSGEVRGADGEHYHMGAINKNILGDISLIFTRSSSNITADIMTAGREATDGPGMMGEPTLMESSLADYGSSGENRWGDYFGIDVDPVDDTIFWGVGMDAAANGHWRTSFFSWSVGNRMNLYVDRAYVGIEEGTPSRPFNTLQEAINAASSTQATNIFVRSNNYNEHPIVSKKIRFLNWTHIGDVQIGRP